MQLFESEEDEGGYSSSGSSSLEIEKASRRLDEEAAIAAAEAEAEFLEGANVEDHSYMFTEDEDPTAAAGKSLMDDIVLAPDLAMVHTRISGLIRILMQYRELGDKKFTRKQYRAQLVQDLALYYGYTPWLAHKFLMLVGVSQIVELMEACNVPRPVTIRTNTLKTKRRVLAQALIGRGVNLDPLPWSKEGLQVYDSTVPIGATPEYTAGHYMLQSAASLMPVIALDPKPHELILDMAAAPGGKTSHIAARMGNTGALVANDVSSNRIRAVVGNCARLGIRNVVTCTYRGQLMGSVINNFDRVLLDAPCSGTGVIDKDPSVKTSRDKKSISENVFLQRNLLLAAIDATNAHSKSGGIIVYSTCSMLVEENEGVIEKVLALRDVKIVDAELPFGTPGFTRFGPARFHPHMSRARRYFPHTHNMSGFFVCKLKKISNANKGKNLPSGGDVNQSKRVKAANKAAKNGSGPSGPLVAGRDDAVHVDEIEIDRVMFEESTSDGEEWSDQDDDDVAQIKANAQAKGKEEEEEEEGNEKKKAKKVSRREAKVGTSKSITLSKKEKRKAKRKTKDRKARPPKSTTSH